MRVDPLFEGVKAMNDLANPHRMKSGRKYLGSIDPTTAANWAKECGAAIGTKEFSKYATTKIRSSEYAHFRAGAERKLF